MVLTVHVGGKLHGHDLAALEYEIKTSQRLHQRSFYHTVL